MRIVGLFLAVTSLSACAIVGTDFKKPDFSPQEQWSGNASRYLQGPVVDRWWESFHDPILSKLVSQALSDCRDVRVALARVGEARGMYRTATGDLFPEVRVDGNLTRLDTSDGAPPLAFKTPLVNSYQLGSSLSWELDVFGRVRRSVEAAQASVEISEEDLHGVQLAIATGVAKNYLVLRTAQNRYRVAEENLGTQEQTLELTRARQQSGLASDLDVSQAQAAVAETKTVLPPLRAMIAQSVHRLSVLVGAPPNTLEGELSGGSLIPTISEVISVSIPTDVIRKRPDIRRAERELAQRTALVGVAEGDLYPRFSLSGSFEWNAAKSSNLFDTNSQGYRFGPALSWSILNFGRVRGLIAAREASVEAAVAAYEGSVLKGLQEVESSLVASTEAKEKTVALLEAYKASERTLELSTELYKSGLVDFQNVLDAQRSVLRFQSEYVQAQGDIATSVIDLYAALGGGWS